MNDYAQLLQKCEAFIREGRPRQVAIHLTHLESRRIPREWRLPLANICRRAGLISLGLKLLFHIVHPKRKVPAPAATPAERAGYAMLLLRNGAVSEAIKEFDRISPVMVPEVYLYRTFACFLNWEYFEAVPLLEQYLRTPLTPYASLVAMSNLAYAKVELRQHDEALPLLEKIVELTVKGQHSQLQSAARAMRTQVFVQMREFGKARKEIDAAERAISLSQGVDHFSIQKWNLILQGLEEQTSEPFEKLRRMAILNHDWEAYRETDLHSLKVHFERTRFDHLYFGSPFPFFRKMICEEFGQEAKHSVHTWGVVDSRCLDLKTGQIDGRQVLNPGRKSHQLISVLMQDFYRPLRVGGLFSELFPSQHFDISSSPDRVRQIISRTRRWLLDENIPARILEQDNFYSFVIEGEFSVRLQVERDVVQPFSRHFEILQERMAQNQSFLARDVEQVLDLPKWTVHKFIKWGIETGRIQRLGASNRGASYILASASTKKSA